MQLGGSRNARIQRHGSSKPFKKLEPLEELNKRRNLKDRKKNLLKKLDGFDEKTISELLHSGLINRDDVKDLKVINRKDKKWLTKIT